MTTIKGYLQLLGDKPEYAAQKSTFALMISEADTFTRNKQIYFFPREIPNLELNRKEILQLILNLARNGLDSMEVDGSLTIKTYIQGDKVVLEIADEGCGIQPENLNKLGIPFSTTKDEGTGPGNGWTHSD